MGSVEVFVKGLVVGFVVAAPVGPIGVLCVRRTLAEGRVAGLLSGLGAALADAFYGCVAAFGVTAIADFLIGHLDGLRLVGGVILCVLGAKTYLSEPARAAVSDEIHSLLGAFGSTFLLTLTNPLTILSFAAIFAGLGIGVTGSSYVAAALLVVGVFIGSAVWWLGLSGGVGYFRQMISAGAMRRINRISGALIGAFGIVALYFGVIGTG
ncbi:MAG: LysE family translocator [Alphaproteobacteria bacterium]